MEHTTRSLRVSRVIVILSGRVYLVLGSLVLMGWCTHTLALVRVRPVFASVQPNTAVLFVLAGVGLLSLVAQRPRLTISTGGALIVVGSLTLFEYLFDVNLGIDQWLLTNTITTAVSHPDRMAPNTALGFSLIGVALLTEFAGVILGFFRIREIFYVILEQASREDFTYALFDREEEIYRSTPPDRQEEGWGQETQLNFHDVTWRLRLWPQPQMLANAYSAMPEVILLVGFLITGLCAEGSRGSLADARRHVPLVGRAVRRRNLHCGCAGQLPHGECADLRHVWICTGRTPDNHCSC